MTESRNYFYIVGVVRWSLVSIDGTVSETICWKKVAMTVNDKVIAIIGPTRAV